MNKVPSVAIIGAGIAGVSLARLLNEAGIAVTLFDKGRGIGGRMATRYSDSAEHDHGAQFFTVRTPGFAAFLSDYQAHYAEWPARVVTLEAGEKSYGRPWFEPHYVSTPRMNSLCKAIGKDLLIHTGYQVQRVTGSAGHWFLESADALSGPFDWVISTAPIPQTKNLLSIDLPEVNYEPVFALLTKLNSAPGFDAAVVKDSPIAWLAVSSSKPMRQHEKLSLIAHADAEWSRAHLEGPVDEVALTLFEALEALGLSSDRNEVDLHHWRYARVQNAADQQFVLNKNMCLGAAGDWGAGNRVEDAFTSASALYAELLPLLLEQQAVG